MLSLLFFALQAHALVNGALLKDEPDVVRLHLPHGHICSGVFVDPYTVLTAAHCVSPEPTAVEMKVISLENDKALPLKVLRVVVNERYIGGFFPDGDIAIIKTEKFAGFRGNFKLKDITLSMWGEGELFGTGRIAPREDKYFRTHGKNIFIHLGQYFFFLGKTRAGDIQHNTGVRVSIAHSDSGGTIIDPASRTIIAVITQTSVNQSDDVKMPTLSVATSVLSSANAKFIRKNLGP